MKKKKVWILYVDTHNGSTDFYAYGSEKSAQKAFLKAFNLIFDTEYHTYRSAELLYEIESAKAFNRNWIRLEELEVTP